MFQDPAESSTAAATPWADPGGALHHPRQGNAEQRRAWVQELLDKVGCPAARRIAIPTSSREASASASASHGPSPSSPLLVCDEAVSALDVSVQSQIVNLLLTLQREMNLASSSSPTTCRWSSTSPTGIAVMYLGGSSSWQRPSSSIWPPSPYTQALIRHPGAGSSQAQPAHPADRGRAIPIRRRAVATSISALPLCDWSCAAPRRPIWSRAAVRLIRVARHFPLAPAEAVPLGKAI